MFLKQVPMALMPRGPDTHPEAQKVQVALLRRASAARRFARARSLSETTIDLAKRAIRRAHPDLDDQDLLVAFVTIHYGQALADRLRAELARRRR